MRVPARLRWFAFLSIFAWWLWAWPSDVLAEGWARKMFEQTHHDFGTVSKNSKAEYAFVLENCYEEEIHIASVRSSCGCTTPVVTKTELKSWEKGQIVAQFNTRSFTGTKSAVITVVIDRPYYAEVQLTVGGTIRTDVMVEPGELKFGEVEVGQSKTSTVQIGFTGRRGMEIVDVQGNSDALEVRLDAPVYTPSSVSYRMHVTLKGTLRAADFLDEVLIITNDPNPRDRQLALAVSARIRPPITVIPETVLLGDIRTGETRQQRVIVKSKKPFSIASIQCEDSRIVFNPSGKEDAKTAHVVPFTFRAELSDSSASSTNQGSESIQQQIRITTTTGEEVTAMLTAKIVR
jgi:hypothetical protein